VLEYDLPNIGDWVGTQLPVVAGSLVDLSTAKSLTLRLRGLDLEGEVQVHLEIGAIGEDLDDDDTLDAEPSSTSTGFTFNDTGRFPAALKVGAGPLLEGNRVMDSEDRDGSGTLTEEDANRVVHEADTAQHHFDGSLADTGWVTATFVFADDDRAKLEQARSIRIVLEGRDPSSSGRIMVDLISVARSAYWADSSSGTVTVREIAERLSAEDPGSGQRLSDVEPDAMEMFHPSGETQEVLEAAWNGTGGADVTVTGYTEKKTGGIAYDTAVVYLRGVALAPTASLAFALLDAEGDGIQWSLLDLTGLADEAWHELRASRKSGTVTLDGIPATGSVTFDADHGELGLLKVTVSGSTDGTLFLDEVHLRDPHMAVGAALKAEASWSRPGVIWKAGSVPLIANASVDQKLSLSTAGFTSLYGTPAQTEEVTSRTKIGVDILYARLRADIVLRDVGGEFVGLGSHRLVIPSEPSMINLTDAFSLSGTREFSREDTLQIQPLGTLAIWLGAKADGTDDLLTQEWTASVAAKPLADLSLGLDLGFSQESTGYVLPGQWYGASWVNAAELVVPWYDGTEVERTEKLSADISTKIGPVNAAVSIDVSATGTDFTTLSRLQEDAIDVSWSVAWPVGGSGDDGAAITLRYARSLELAGVRAAGDPFTAEASVFFRRLADQKYFLLGLPLLEILLDDTEKVLDAWDGIDAAAWEPSLSVSVERRSGSRLIDLFVPSIAELSVTRVLEKRAELSKNEIQIRPRLFTHAINLFGKLGSHPIMPFYRTDEFSIALSGVVSGPAAADFSLSALTLELSADILGFKDQSLTLVNVFSLASEHELVTDGLQTAFDWTTRPAGGVRLPYLPESIAHAGYFEHRESLDLDLRLSGSSTSHPLTLILGHATSLVYPDRGSVKASLKAGFDVESLSGTHAYRFAIEAGLEAKLSF
jgi:hypothetical protein